MIPLQETVLLLPNASVAEIIGYTAPEAVEDTPPWMLGYIHWRGYRLPLVSYEVMSGSGGAAPTSSKLRIAIFNGINNNADLPFYGVLTQGIPRLLRASQRVVHESEGDQQEDSSLVLAHAKVRDEAVVIPDLDEMESMLATSMVATEQA
jgi:chemosensory pili system protein ChpC